MSKRKTFNVEEFKQSINKMLAGSVINPEGRKSMIVILEDVLMQTGNYKGYRYLSEKEVPAGHKAGINHSDYFQPTHEELFGDTDNSRVCYL